MALDRRSFLAAAASFLTAPAARARPLDDAVASGILRVAVYDDHRPFSYEADGTARGIDVEIAHALARKLGLQAEILMRMAGEGVEDDLRANVWRGPLTGGPLADVMLHVPADRELALRNELVVIGPAYFRHRIAMVTTPDAAETLTDPADVSTERIAVEVDTLGDFYLLGMEGGRLRPNVTHHVTFPKAVEAFRRGEAAMLVGTRAQIEGHLAETERSKVRDLRMPPSYRSSWAVGYAVKIDSRDLGYVVRDALAELRDSGDLERICAAHGVSFSPPAG